MLVAAYYPWLDFKWGTTTGVAIKNPYITDIFSQIYLWKELIAKSFMDGQWPLWNQYSYSGYPLLANFQSGALNIFNVIFIIFGMVNGWNIFLIVGIVIEILSMYWYLRLTGISYLSSIIASFTFGFSGFSILWMPYANANYALASIPLALCFIEKYLKTNNQKYLFLISPTIFFMVTAGHFQVAIYGLLLISFYLIYKKIYNFLPLIIGLAMSSVQLLPTYELSNLSVRFTEGFIDKNNFGLSPLNKLITLYIPDFFGNPSTFNYWGFFNYHETNFYVGILGLIALIWSVFNYRLLGKNQFFLFCSLISLLLGFDTFLGKAIYLLNFPGISTSAAGRISALFSFSTSILVANFLDNILKSKLRKSLFPSLVLIVLNLLTIVGAYYTLSQPNFSISFRNSLFPGLILLGLTFSILISSKIKYFKTLILIIVIADLFRFGWKSTPFVSKTYIYPQTPLTQQLARDTDIFRIDREYGSIFPPNTWTAYGLMSPSGYDPLSVNNYVIEYNRILNQNQDSHPSVSRYSELFKFDPSSLGEFNVKYLLMQKNYSPDKKSYNYNREFNEKSWIKSFETESYTLFENPQLQPRIQLSPPQTNPIITKYSSNSIKISAKSINPNSTLILRDTFYPGWKALVNDQATKIDKYHNIYRQINVPPQESTIEFIYQPNSFYTGIIITLISLIILLLILIL